MRKFIFIMSILVVTILAGCVPEENVDKAVENGGAYEREIDANKNEENEPSKESEELSEDSEDDKSEQERVEQSEEKLKVISTYEYEAETVEFNDDLDRITDKVHDLGGYIRSSNVKVDKQSMNDKRTAELVLRVPRNNVVETIQFLKETVSIGSEVINSIDITDDYYDMEEKLESLISRENRLMELYENATEISDIIEIDDKLFEVDELKKEELRKKSKVDDRIVFSRIEVNLKEVNKLSSEPDIEKTYGEKVSDALSSTIKSIKDFFVSTFVILIKYSPLVLIAIVALYAYKKFVYDRAKREEDISTNNPKKDSKK